MRHGRLSLSVVIALGLAACATSRTPAVFNAFDGPERPDSEIGLVRQVSARLTMIDEKPVPAHPDADHFYYRDFRLLPGQHTLTARRTWGASILVAPSGYIEESRYLLLNAEAGHTYELHADRTTGIGYKVYFWIEDTTLRKVVSGTPRP